MVRILSELLLAHCFIVMFLIVILCDDDDLKMHVGHFHLANIPITVEPLYNESFGIDRFIRFNQSSDLYAFIVMKICNSNYKICI